MSSFETDPEQMKNASDQIAEYAREYDSIRKVLLTTATSMGKAYDSADSRSYVSKIEGFCGDLQNLANKLHNAANTIKEQAIEYNNRTDSNYSAAKRLPQ